MKTLFEFTGFLAAALAAHVAILPSIGEGPAASQGGGGAGSITLVASSGNLTDLVAQWSKPPLVAQAVTMTAPQMPAPAATQASLSSVAPAMAVPVLPSSAAQEPLPQIDLTAAPPPSDVAPSVSPRPKGRPETPKQARAPARAAETASGTGRNASSGTASAAPRAAAAASGTSPAALSQWGGAIRNSIERGKRYPRGTRASGVVRLSIRVGTNGALAGVAIAGSSGDAALDRAALTAVQRARLPAAPNGVATGSQTFTLPMTFRP